MREHWGVKMSNWKNDFVNFHSNELQVRAPGNLSPSDGLAIYEVDYRARIFEALSKNYEATWVVLGDQAFLEASADYIEKFPSISYTLNNYGAFFPSYLKEKADIYGLEASEMSAYEQAFWQLFHQEDTCFSEIDHSVLLSKKFSLDHIFLFQSSLNLDLVWANRENGINDSVSDKELYGDFCFVLSKKKSKVESTRLSKNVFDLLSMLKEKNSFSLLTYFEISQSEWLLIFDILSYEA